jgi:general secretion pathway protein N
MSTRRILLFGGIGVAAYLLFLALTLPAHLLLGWLLPANAPVRLGTPVGTPWHGQARQLQIGGSRLGRVSWHIHPWALFTGRLDYDLHVQGEMTRLDGEAALSPGGKIVVSNLRGPLALSAVLPWFQLPLPPNSATGRLVLDLDRFVFADRRPTTIRGRIKLNKLNALRPQPMPLGGYVATFSTNDSGIHGRARDTGGPIHLDATITIKKNGHYQARGTLTPRGDADAHLKQVLPFLGRTDDDGNTHFSFSGSARL